MSLIDASAGKSSGRGSASRSQSIVSLCSPPPSHCVGMLPRTGRMSYWPIHATPLGPMVMRSVCSGPGTAGIGRSLVLQVSRRAAVTTVAVVVTCGAPLAPACVICTVQCCVERLVRTAVACMSKAPASMAAA